MHALPTSSAEDMELGGLAEGTPGLLPPGTAAAQLLATIGKLRANMAQITVPEPRAEAAQQVAQQVAGSSCMGGAAAPPVGMEVDEATRVVGDTGESESGGGAMVALGLYPRQSLLNHSCVPNCALGFGTGGAVHVRAQRDVCAGEELVIDYLGAAEDAPPEERRRCLVERYGFDCTCERCLPA